MSYFDIKEEYKNDDVFQPANQIDETQFQIWRSSLMLGASRVISDHNQHNIQRKTQMWNQSDEMTYPAFEQIAILPNGVLAFQTDMFNGMQVLFSTWILFGEVRIGTRIDNNLLQEGTPHEQLVNSLKNCYGGMDCTVVTDSGGGYTVFDWIFKDGFASTDVMIKAMRDPMLSSAISIRIGESLTHLYINIIRLISEANGCQIQEGRFIPASDRIRRFVGFTGNSDEVLGFFIERGAVPAGNLMMTPEGNGEIIIETPVNWNPILGYVKNMDSEFTVLFDEVWKG